jgi:serine/threonine protein kinase
MRELRIGSVFAGHRLDEVAGEGGMGVVYRATHLALERPVALKLISPVLAGDDAFRERFKRESRTAASLKHPHVITIYHAGEEDGLLYITMDFIDGTDLRRLIRRGGRLEPGEAARIISQIASGLDAAHARGLVHRDVKPANVLIHGRGTARHAYLTDFGLTRHTTSVGGLTQTGQWVGTLDYVAPEQIRGLEVDARTDVYSLGCMLFQVLSGEVPYPSENDIAKMWSQINDPPPSLRERAPQVPQEFDEMVRRAMAKDPGQRYPSAGDLAEAALAAAEGRPVGNHERSVATRAAAPIPSETRTRTAQSPVAVDKGRGPVTPPTSRQPRIVAGPRLPVLVALAVSAGVAGFLVSAIAGSSHGTSSAKAGQVGLSYDASWTRDLSGGRPIKGLRLANPIALTYSPLSGTGVLRAGSIEHPAPGADSMPAALKRRFAKAPAPKTVKVGGVEAIAYSGNLRSSSRLGGTLSLFIVPTTQGYFAVACEGPTSRLEGFARACREVAASVNIRGGNVLNVGPSKTYARQLGAIIDQLRAARLAGSKGLRSSSHKRQAHAAVAVAAAHHRAAAALRKLNPPPQDQVATAALAAAASRLAGAFDRLASATRSEDVGGYDAARSDIDQGDAALSRVMLDLRHNGYRLR